MRLKTNRFGSVFGYACSASLRFFAGRGLLPVTDH